MTAKKKEQALPEARADPGKLEDFVNGYLAAYRNRILSKDSEEAHLPQFFKDYPFSIEAHGMPNGSLCVLFKKASRTRIAVIDGDFEAIRARLKDQDFDYMVVFPPFTSFDADEAARLASLDADRDMRIARRLQMLAAAESRLSGIHDDMQAMVELNPWLDQQTAEQKRKLDDAKALINDLYREVEMSREERFAGYATQLAEAMAFERGEMEEAAGEIALQMESAVEEMDARMSASEERLAQLAAEVKESSARVKALEKGGSFGKLDDAVSDLEEEVKGLSKDLGALKKEFESVREDAAASKDIKETVFRDSKRTYNLNERVTDLERSVSSLKTDLSSTAKADMKALEGRMNVLERDLRVYVQKCVRDEMGARSPVVVTSEPVVETTVEEVPGNPGMKKTVKRTTTKKTTRK